MNDWLSLIVGMAKVTISDSVYKGVTIHSRLPRLYTTQGHGISGGGT